LAVYLSWRNLIARFDPSHRLVLENFPRPPNPISVEYCVNPKFFLPREVVNVFSQIGFDSAVLFIGRILQSCVINLGETSKVGYLAI